MRAARSTLIGSHLGGGLSPFAGFPPPMACVCPRTVPVRAACAHRVDCVGRKTGSACRPRTRVTRGRAV
eukprot:5396778-Prymnesium_polylepis.1